MARSPLEVNAGLESDDIYFQNWNRLSTLIAQGKSFSGRERHCAFLNTGTGGAFASVAGAARLDWPDDGRALAVTDWDGDGDLDLWMTQRNGPRVRFVRNDVLAANRYVAFDLQSVRGNRDAIGARVSLVTTQGRELHRTVRAGDGFLSQSSKSLHFGLLEGEDVENVSVRWPGVTEPEVVGGVALNRKHQLKEGVSMAEQKSERTEVNALLSSDPERPEASSGNRRLVLIQRIDFPSFRYVNFKGEIEDFDPEAERPGPTLVSLWASWCAPCVDELKMLSEMQDRLTEKGVEVLALNIEAVVEEGGVRDLSSAKALVARENYPLSLGVIDEGTLQALTRVQHRAVAKQLPLALPTSFLVDREGQLGVLYFGPVTSAQLEADLALLEAAPKAIEAAAFPFAGRNGIELFQLSTLAFAQAYRDGGYIDDARRLLSDLGDSMSLQERYFLGTLEQSQLNWAAAAEAYGAVLKQSPGQVAVHVPLGVALWKAGQRDEAEGQFEAAERAASDQPRLWGDLGRAHLQLGESDKAITYFERSGNREHLAGALVKAGRVEEGVTLYEALLKEQPDAASLRHRLAWCLASWEEASEKDVERALSLAKRLGEETQYQDPRAVDVLALAHAQAGNLEVALREAGRARRLARATGEERLVEEINERMQAYRSGRPWREDEEGKD